MLIIFSYLSVPTRSHFCKNSLSDLKIILVILVYCIMFPFKIVCTLLPIPVHTRPDCNDLNLILVIQVYCIMFPLNIVCRLIPIPVQRHTKLLGFISFTSLTILSSLCKTYHSKINV